MENALLIGLSRQVALARELDVVANNMANVNTNGFKARDARFAEYLMPNARADAFPRPDQRLSYVIDAGTPLDLSPGSVERTGNALDAAIKGDGYFVVQAPQGERYTRNGAFEIGPAGQLVTSDGHVVQGENGPIAITPQETGIQIGADGTVSTNQGVRGRLRLVTFANPQALKSEGTNLFASPQPAQPAGPATRIEAGAVERSNVKAVLEMSRLMEVSRSYTSVAGMLSRMEELRRTAIQRLSEAV